VDVCDLCAIGMQKEQLWADFSKMCAIGLVVLSQVKRGGDAINKQQLSLLWRIR